MTFTPYIFFHGNAAQAIDFYAEVFGADNVVKMPFSDAPPEAGLADVDRLMHAQIDVGGQTLMCSDVPPDMPYQPQAGFAVSHAVETLEEAKSTFAKLCDGGEATMPFAATFFSSGFGMCKDRFGTDWMVMVNDG
ncbi:MAG: VOC family protein [Cognatishimia sp.]